MLRFLAVALLMEPVSAGVYGGPPPSCLMAPRHVAMGVPEHGFVWLRGEDHAGPCEAVPADAWLRRPSKGTSFAVRAEGASGSGRYWTVTVGVTRPQEKEPHRGFCLGTSTVGWRTLQRFGSSPLSWIADRDGDGRPELIIWDSFPLRAEPSLAEYGLVAWVYETDGAGNFTVNWGKTRSLAGELAASYRRAPGPGQEALQVIRDIAAQALAALASGACVVPVERVPR